MKNGRYKSKIKELQTKKKKKKESEKKNSFPRSWCGSKNLISHFFLFLLTYHNLDPAKYLSFGKLDLREVFHMLSKKID